MKLGIIGCGKMGRALIGGILKAGIFQANKVMVYDAWPEAVSSAVNELGIKEAKNNAEVIDASDVVLLCVKPQCFPEMYSELGSGKNRLLISIAAGVLIDTIEKGINKQHRVIRVMPNTPALVGRGASAYAIGSDATEADAELTEKLLASIGYVCRVEEKELDAVTALSGSGPAYIFLMIESLIAAGIEQGLTPEIARNLAIETVAGAAELVSQTGESPSTLRENVTSPKGTTFAALESFRADGFSDMVKRAMQAARNRSIELGKS